ncbi:MAG: TolC family protein [Desulfobacterales bacterium]|nr:MAG: TolC family protein [Desulfobacterales bacterium]
MIRKRLRILWLVLLLGSLLTLPLRAAAQDPAQPLNLRQTIDEALQANLGLQRSKEEVQAAQATKKARRAEFLPNVNVTYSLTHRDVEQSQKAFGLPGTPDFVVRPQDEYAFVTTFTQPIFTGFALINQYKIASLGLNVAEFNEKVTRQDVILDAKNAYFSVLKTQKLVDIAKQTVKNIAAQKEVAENFYQVGMSPLNELLQAQVELANAKQDQIVAQNNLEIAKSQFNTILRRPINAPVAIEDILDYRPYAKNIDESLSMANRNRLEIKVADLEIEIAEKDVKLAQRDYVPSINLKWTGTNLGTDYRVNGGEGISDSSFWNVQAVASWDIWAWGKTYYGMKEKLSRLSQAKLRKTEILDNINLEVKQAYLRTKEAEENITTIEKAIEQARENFRINEERYKEQVATTTDVLDAQTLLARTMTNYFNALYDFKIAKATLHRAMGQEVLE